MQARESAITAPSELDPALRERAAAIRLLALDIDGTLTDGRLFIGAEGEAHKAFHVKDGLGLKLLMQAGVEIAWITARESRIVATRARELGVERLIQGCREKRTALSTLAAELGLEAAQVAFMGDDLPDLPALGWCGLACGPADAHWAVAQQLHWRSRLPGGHGAVRELADLLLLAQGRFDSVCAPFRQ